MSAEKRERDFKITVLGRTLEHLGTQMYKRRDVAIAELVANCWDAGATRVDISVPPEHEYDSRTSVLTVTDNGAGMDDDEVEHNYLVIGRNRRSAGQPPRHGRLVMGRKGVGKLAGFGLARNMTVVTWREGQACTLTLDSDNLKTDSDHAERVAIRGFIAPVDSTLPHSSGTRIIMQSLKHKTPVNIEGLNRALARRFSTRVRGEMEIYLNGERVFDTKIDFDMREPESGEETVEIAPGQTIKWWAGFSNTVLPKELQGFTVIVNGKTAQAPPYFFDVEGTASGQHGTKYLTGVIEADYLDAESDDISDRVSTDRQEIDWEDELAAPLKSWGDALTRRLLRERTEQRGEKVKKEIRENREFADRIGRLDRQSANQVDKFLVLLGKAGTENDRVNPLADTILRAFEYRQFHDFITELDVAAADPETFQQAVEYMHDWKLLESRAVLEVVRGRLDIIDKFYDLIVNDAPETAHQRGRENLHDLIADYPWLINPEWQVFSEEKRITTMLREWGKADLADPSYEGRYDFLALSGDGELVVIEIKRSGHAVTLEDTQKLEQYADRLEVAQKVGFMAFISNSSYEISPRARKAWDEREDGELLTWRGIQSRARTYYEHYRAILEGDVQNVHFGRKEKEVARTREVLESGAYRGVQRRREGVGPQDVDYTTPEENDGE
ncbi:ATP-binding protein [Streptomyces werraensis]|uniref:ATP-binding protein n=1 Tax=Streptomyces werraensis TaxID=68284 RepID=UPI0037F8BFEB